MKEQENALIVATSRETETTIPLGSWNEVFIVEIRYYYKTPIVFSYQLLGNAGCKLSLPETEDEMTQYIVENGVYGHKKVERALVDVLKERGISKATVYGVEKEFIEKILEDEGIAVEFLC